VLQKKQTLGLCLKLLKDLCATVANLPLSVSEADVSDLLALFAMRPVLNTAIEDHWEIVDPVLNRLLGWGKTIEEIKLLVRRGPQGMDGFCNWLEVYMTEGRLRGAKAEAETSEEVYEDKCLNIRQDRGPWSV
jgi:hypothetical protein